MHQRFKLTSSTLPQVRSLLKLFVNWSHLHKKNKMHQENEQPHNLFKAWNAGGSKWFPAKEPEQLYLAFWVSTSYSLNPTHLKLFLCHDGAFHAFHFQFTSDLLLPSHQLASCCRFFSLSSLHSSKDYYFHIKPEVPLLTWDVMPFQSTITVMDISCSTTFQASWESRFCCFLLQKSEFEYSKGSSSHTSLKLLCRMEYVEKKYFFFLHLPWIWKPYF